MQQAAMAGLKPGEPGSLARTPPGRPSPADRPTVIVELQAEPGHKAPWPAIRKALKSLLRTYGLVNRSFVSAGDLETAIRSGQVVQVEPALDATRTEPPF